MGTGTWKRFSFSSALLAMCVAAIGFNACGGDDSPTEETGGIQNVGGSGGGKAGTTNKGGNAGTVGKGGNAGNAGGVAKGGSTGTGGGAGSVGKGGSAGTAKGGGTGKGGGKLDGGPDATSDAKADGAHEGGADATTSDGTTDAAAQVRYDFGASADIAGWAETSSSKLPVEISWSATDYPSIPGGTGTEAGVEAGTGSSGSLAVTFKVPEGGLLLPEAAIPEGGVDYLAADVVITPSPAPAPGSTITCEVYVPAGCKLQWIQMMTADPWTNGTPTSWEGEWRATSIVMPAASTAATRIGVQFGYQAGSDCTGKTVLVDRCSY